jgi:hypothetical protein
MERLYPQCPVAVVFYSVGVNIICALVVLGSEYSALFDGCTRMWVMLLVTFTLIYGQVCSYICCQCHTAFEWLGRNQHLFSICLLHYFAILVLFVAWAYIIVFDNTCDQRNHMLLKIFVRYQFTLMTCFMCIWTPYVATACKRRYDSEPNVITGSLPERNHPLSVKRIIVSSYVPMTDEMCCICHGLYVEPVILSCTHSYCLMCITKWDTINPRCPICRQEIDRA